MDFVVYGHSRPNKKRYTRINELNSIEYLISLNIKQNLFQDKDAFKMDSFKPLQGYRPSSARLSDQTIYSLSYQVIDKEVAKKCRPAISKPREAPLTQFKLVLPVSSRTCTVHRCFVAGENFLRSLLFAFSIREHFSLRATAWNHRQLKLFIRNKKCTPIYI